MTRSASVSRAATSSPAIALQFIYGVGDVNFAELDRSVRGGFGDPVVGVRYSLPQPRFGWDVVAEVAAKIVVDGERFLLSTGEHDLRRADHPAAKARIDRPPRALFLGQRGVLRGRARDPGRGKRDHPDAHRRLQLRLESNTSVILQGYASRSVVQHTTVEELTEDKYQLSLGLQSRGKNVLWSVAVTENISNFENTPDIGVQFGVAYMPKAK